MVCRPDLVKGDGISMDILDHWVIIDTQTRRPYISNKSFINKNDAKRLLNDLLKYHWDTEWAHRLKVVQGIELRAKNLRRENDGRRRNSRPKGCPGNKKIKLKRDLSPTAKMYGSTETMHG